MSVCRCEIRRSGNVEHAYLTGEFIPGPVWEVRHPGTFAVRFCDRDFEAVMAARHVAGAGRIPPGLAHDMATRLLCRAAWVYGLEAVCEQKVQDESGHRRKSIDLVIYRPRHTCPQGALLLVEFKREIPNRSQARAAIEQVLRYQAMHPGQVETAVVADDAPDAVREEFDIWTPEHLLSVCRLTATQDLVAASIADLAA